MKNLFESLPENIEKESFENILQKDNIKLERIVSKGHATPSGEWYDQGQDEWVMIVQGEAVLVFEDGTEYHMQQGSYLNIPAHSRHRVKWTPPAIETIWLALHY